MKSVIAIVGRANVGKSTLFNRLAGQKVAIVEDLPGTTRDRVFADIEWHDREMMLVDTAGLETKPGSSFAQKVRSQVEDAITDADVLIFMVDVRDGSSAADQEIADRCGKQHTVGQVKESAYTRQARTGVLDVRFAFKGALDQVGDNSGCGY